VLGVWLPRKAAQVLLKLVHGPVYPPDYGMSQKTFKAHVWRINNLYLRETTFWIHGMRGGDHAGGFMLVDLARRIRRIQARG